jgi:NADH-quinone oxidoreductase subunit M
VRRIANFAGLQGVWCKCSTTVANIIGMWMVLELVERELGARKISALGGLAQKAPVLAILLRWNSISPCRLPMHLWENSHVQRTVQFNMVYGIAD